METRKGSLSCAINIKKNGGPEIQTQYLLGIKVELSQSKNLNY